MTGLDPVAALVAAILFVAPLALAYLVYVAWRAGSAERENARRIDSLLERVDGLKEFADSLAADLGPTLDWRRQLEGRVETLERGRPAPLPAEAPPARLPTSLPPRPEPGAPEGPGVYSSVAPRLPSLEHEPPKQEGDSDHNGVPTRVGLGPAGPERDPRLATGVWVSPGAARRGMS